MNTTQTRSKIMSNHQEKRLNPDQRRVEALTFAARGLELHADSVAAPTVSPRGSSVYGWRTSFLRKHWQECVYYVAVFLFGVFATLVASGGFSK
jgi:hypothetical protein